MNVTEWQGSWSSHAVLLYFGRYPEDKQEDGYKYDSQYVYEEPEGTQSDVVLNDKKEVYLEEKPYDPSEDLERLAGKSLPPPDLNP